MKMKYRIPQLFCLKVRYGMGIFPYEIVLPDIPFKKFVGPKQRFKISEGSLTPLKLFQHGQ
jgi:hypothetical protein